MLVSSQEKEQEVVAFPTKSRRPSISVKGSISGVPLEHHLLALRATDNTTICVVHKMSAAT